MRFSKNQAPLITLIALVVAVISAMLRAISAVLFYDHIGYYTSGAALPVISNIIFAVAIAAFAVCSLLFVGKEDIPAPRSITKYASVLVAASMIYSAVMSAISLGQAYDLRVALSMVTALISAAFFLMLAFAKKHGMATALCGTGFILWLALAWFISYNDFYVPMNSPEKLFFHFGCLGAALLIVAELRAIFGISKPKLYYFSLWTALLTLSAASIPTLYQFIFNKTESSVLTESLVLLELLVWAVVRAISLAAKTPTDTPSPEKTETTEE